jgi:hypothetical protein
MKEAFSKKRKEFLCIVDVRKLPSIQTERYPLRVHWVIRSCLISYVNCEIMVYRIIMRIYSTI